MIILAFIQEQISYATVPELIATGFVLSVYLFEVYLMTKNMEE